MTSILFVDDEQNVLQALQRSLRGRYTIEVAAGGEAGLAALEARGPFGVVVSDMRMPGMDGIEFLKRVKVRSPDSVRVMLTGNADLETAMEAVNQGNIFRFLRKPCPPESMHATLDASVRQYQLVTAERQLLENTLGGCIRVLTEILSMTDARLFARCTSLQELTREVTKAMKLENAWEVEAAAMLAQIGSVAIPPIVITRARSGKTLAGAEKDMLGRIPDIGHDLLRHVPRLEGVAAIVKYQDRRFDGTGHPADAVRGGEIPIGSRLLKILSDVASAQEDGLNRAKAFGQLLARPGAYDDALLKVVSGILVPPDTGPAPEIGTQAVSLKALRVGQVLAGNVVTSENTILISAGQMTNATILERLRNFASTVGVKEPILVRSVPAHATAAAG